VCESSPSPPPVCAHPAWATQQLSAPQILLHVLDRTLYPQSNDPTVAIGLDGREQLMEELARLDEERARLAQEQGPLTLEAARQRIIEAGYQEPQLMHPHGSPVATLQELETGMRLLALGRRRDGRLRPSQVIGSHLENAIGSMRRPVLVTPSVFRIPRSVLLAYDGSATAEKGIDMLCQSPLLRGLPIHVVMIGADTGNHRQQLASAAT